jgi:predicted acyltransferase
MIIVDDVGGLVPAISHSPWDGVTIADFVFPFFLFIVGVSLAFAFKVVQKNMQCYNYINYLTSKLNYDRLCIFSSVLKKF